MNFTLERSVACAGANFHSLAGTVMTAKGWTRAHNSQNHRTKANGYQNRAGGIGGTNGTTTGLGGYLNGWLEAASRSW